MSSTYDSSQVNAHVRDGVLWIHEGGCAEVGPDGVEEGGAVTRSSGRVSGGSTVT